MTLRNAFPGAELHSESEGISELEEREVHSSNVRCEPDSFFFFLILSILLYAAIRLFWELHIRPGLLARNLDMVGDRCCSLSSHDLLITIIPPPKQSATLLGSLLPTSPAQSTPPSPSPG